MQSTSIIVKLQLLFFMIVLCGTPFQSSAQFIDGWIDTGKICNPKVEPNPLAKGCLECRTTGSGTTGTWYVRNCPQGQACSLGKCVPFDSTHHQYMHCFDAGNPEGCSNACVISNCPPGTTPVVTGSCICNNSGQGGLPFVLPTCSCEIVGPPTLDHTGADY